MGRPSNFATREVEDKESKDDRRAAPFRCGGFGRKETAICETDVRTQDQEADRGEETIFAPHRSGGVASSEATVFGNGLSSATVYVGLEEIAKRVGSSSARLKGVDH